MKINISLNDDLVARIDNYADENYMSRSGLISLACTNFLNTYEVIDAVKSLSVTISKIADTGSIDEETQKELQEFQRISAFLVGSKNK